MQHACPFLHPYRALLRTGVGIANSILNYFGFTFFFLVVTTTTTGELPTNRLCIDPRDQNVCCPWPCALWARGMTGPLTAPVARELAESAHKVTKSKEIPEFTTTLSRALEPSEGEVPQEVEVFDADKEAAEVRLSVLLRCNAACRRGQSVPAPCGDRACPHLEFQMTSHSSEGPALLLAPSFFLIAIAHILLSQVKRRCSKVIGNAIFIALCIGTVSAVALYCFGGLLVTRIASSNSAAAFPFALEYIKIKCLTIPMLLVTFALSGAYRGYKDLMRPLLASTTATLVKMLMDYLFLMVYKVCLRPCFVSRHMCLLD